MRNPNPNLCSERQGANSKGVWSREEDQKLNNKGAWSREEDKKLIDYIRTHGEGCWRSLPKAAGKKNLYIDLS